MWRWGGMLSMVWGRCGCGRGEGGVRWGLGVEGGEGRGTFGGGNVG